MDALCVCVCVCVWVVGGGGGLIAGEDPTVSVERCVIEMNLRNTPGFRVCIVLLM